MPDCTMTHGSPLDETICSILTRFNRIAVVGLSDRRSRESHRVASYMQAHGYTILPINPRIDGALGVKSYPDLTSAPGPIEIVNIFRRTEHLAQVVEQAIQARARAIWMQSGLSDERAAARARAAGLQVVMNRCIMVEHGHHTGDGLG